MRSGARWIVLAAAVSLLVMACGEPRQDPPALPPPDPEAGRVLFEMKCMSCHTIGRGDRTGPDLKGVTRRRTRAWLVRWMKDPVGMAKNDPDGRALFARYRNVPMPPTNLSDEQLADVLAYIEKDGAP